MTFTYRWAWKLATDSRGRIDTEQLQILVDKYNNYVKQHPNLEQLIAECDIDHNKELDDTELFKLLQVR